jgi:hypothetical protein
MGFTRTISGLEAKYLFYAEPLVWVEGPEDIPFYRQALGNPPYRFEALGSKDQCVALAGDIVKNNVPYVVVMDGDYGVLSRRRSPHRRVVLLHRYSAENYLFEKSALEQVCRCYAQADPSEEIIAGRFEKALQQLDEVLKDLIVLDLAHSICETGVAVLPDSIEALLVRGGGVRLDPTRVSSSCAAASSCIDASCIAKAAAIIDEFTRTRHIKDVICGHLVFGIIRRLVFHTVRSRTGRNPNIDNDGLRVLLCAQVWELIPSPDHVSLRRRLLRAAREAADLRAH